MIGFYNHSVILTYLSLVSGVIGMTFAIEHNFLFAIICLLVAGFCDLFDGRVARAMKNRTEDEKGFGVQIDSLCDLVSFAVFPALISYNLGGNKVLGLISACAIVLGGVIRLAFFNVIELKRQADKDNTDHDYHGLPVTTTALIVPFLFLFKGLLGTYFVTAFQLAIIVIAILFILDFKIKKPGLRLAIIQVIIGAGIAVAAVLLNT